MSEPHTPPAPLPYEVYYRSGSYDRRYPRPNPAVLARALDALGPRSHLIDFGCGTGRYLMALAPHVARAAGFDISPTALALLRQRLTEPPPMDVAVLGPEPLALDSHVARHGPADLVLCLFGVLAHIQPAAARAETLAMLAGLIAPDTGRLLISVPNRRRRFLREQRAAGQGARGGITYTRRTEDGPVDLPYQLYDPQSLEAELARAGLAIRGLWAESILPESWLTRHPLWCRLDDVLRKLVPARWGYGLLVLAARA